MNDTLKVAGRIGAELGAAKAENERLRGLLRELREITSEYAWDADLEARVDATLSQQAEPTDTFTAVDMATAAAQGFRDGQAAVEPAPAQDEREAFNTEYDRICNRPLTMREIAWRMWQARAARPAQTEQPEPVARISLPDADSVVDALLPVNPNVAEHELQGIVSAVLFEVGRMNAAPIAQTAPQPEQSGLVEAVTPEIIDWVRCGLSVNGRLVDGTHPALEKLCAAYRSALSAQGASK
ncbi:hypothetical protein [Stutzerimonas nitrititolerans]|uniref:hypothetical protein n=1 Tax=Stutzerimonas nitrititolerans TaxID=2482751 RepID=UPI0028B1F395|nr:hypothetical protein [Stutzerimonas nitrititolerans]